MIALLIAQALLPRDAHLTCPTQCSAAAYHYSGSACYQLSAASMMAPTTLLLLSYPGPCLHLTPAHLGPYEAGP
jgi:hypothetical protein